MDPQQLAFFEDLVSKVQLPENDIRAPAEAKIMALQNDPNKYIAALVLTLKNSPSIANRLWCATMARTVLRHLEPHWRRCSPETQANVKNVLLGVMSNEQSRPLRRAVSFAVSALACQVLRCDADTSLTVEEKRSIGEWNEVLPLVLQLAKSNDNANVQMALTILGDITEYAFHRVRPHLQDVRAILIKTAEMRDLDTRHASLKCWYQLLLSLEEDRLRKPLEPLIPMYFKTLAIAIKEDEMVARKFIEAFADMAKFLPRFFRPVLRQILQQLLGHFDDADIDASLRRQLIGILLNFCQHGGAMVRKVDQFAQRMVQVAFKLMLNVDDDQKWIDGGDEDYWGFYDFSLGLEMVDRLAGAFGGKILLPLFLPVIRQFADKDDWRYRHAAFMCIGEMAENTAKDLRKMLDKVMDLVLKHAQNDPEPRVRWAAINAVSQLSVDFAPKFQQRFHARVVPALIGCLLPQQHPRVRRHAALCVVDFCSQADEKVLVQHADKLLRSLFEMLKEKDSIPIVESAVDAIAYVARHIEDGFGEYYDHFMPSMMEILHTANGPNLRQLRARCIECASFMGMSVGAEKFNTDGMSILRMLVDSIHNGLDGDDPQWVPIIESTARIILLFGARCADVLPKVIPHLLDVIERDDECMFLDEADMADANVDENDENIQIVPVRMRGIGNTVLVINTLQLQQKAAACSAVYNYCESMRGAFFPWAKRSLELLVGLVEYRYNEDVRVAAVALMPELLKCVKDAIKDDDAKRNAIMHDMWSIMRDPFLKCVRLEFQMQSALGVLYALEESLTELPFELSQDDATEITSLLSMLITESNMRRQERHDAAQSPDFDQREAEVMEGADEEDDEFLGYCGNVLNVVMRNLKDKYADMFTAKMHPLYAPMLAPTGTTGQQTAALCAYCDAVEFMGEKAVANFMQKLFEFSMEYASSGDKDVRHAALFGLGLGALHGGPAFTTQLPQIMPKLLAQLTREDARSEEQDPVTDNAISAIGKILEKHPDALGADVWDKWLGWMPLNGDELEAQSVHTRLMKFVEQKNDRLFGAGQKNLGKIVEVLAKVYGSSVSTDELNKRIEAFFKGGQSMIQGLQMSDKVKEAVMRVVSA
jgi:importin-5